MDNSLSYCGNSVILSISKDILEDENKTITTNK